MRRRMRQKTPEPPGFREACAAVPVVAPRPWQVTRHAEQRYASHIMKATCVPGRTYGDRRAWAVAAFRALQPQEQEPWLRAAEATQPGAGARAASEAEVGRGSWIADAFAKDVRYVGVLLTWNGGWASADLAVRNELENLRRAAVPRREWGTRVAIAGGTGLQELFNAFWDELSGRARAAGLLHCSASMEISMNSTDSARVHLHVFASLPVGHTVGRMKHVVSKLTFAGRLASHGSPCSAQVRGLGGRQRAIHQGHYYLQCPKLGVVFQRTSYAKHRDYQVRSIYVVQLWRNRKLAHEDAISEIWHTRDAAHKWVAEIERVARHEHDEDLQKAARQCPSHQILRPFRPPTEEEIAWLEQFSTLGQPKASPLLRFRPLIYDGPSRTGKSEKAIAWFPEKSLVLNCQNVATPNLKDWLSGQYRALVCEECTWELMWNNRMLFQSGPRPVCIGQSACNEHAYSVCLWQTPIVLTSNAFWAGCGDESARDWITKNAFYVKVTEPLWME